MRYQEMRIRLTYDLALRMLDAYNIHGHDPETIQNSLRDCLDRARQVVEATDEEIRTVIRGRPLKTDGD